MIDVHFSAVDEGQRGPDRLLSWQLVLNGWAAGELRGWWVTLFILR